MFLFLEKNKNFFSPGECEEFYDRDDPRCLCQTFQKEGREAMTEIELSPCIKNKRVKDMGCKVRYHTLKMISNF